MSVCNCVIIYLSMEFNKIEVFGPKEIALARLRKLSQKNDKTHLPVLRYEIQKILNENGGTYPDFWGEIVEDLGLVKDRGFYKWGNEQ